ncbi:S-layer homology domain-containing protein [Paenibacillus sp. UMB4589-SE434]|uniref:S-layer homology domain-containing protein n=1 Tax=Paenibacillus sp. UMB4589-SE434 TaxID=3046314 RepID=UPI00254DD722|nr:S-layer homology domain-containing protein [Paenibacillus sp. UMB4589-SE434]MDK8179968.1 S-layer homology domain-containing protein [Paenibacillus sp. UMB4589-SE434]
MKRFIPALLCLMLILTAHSGSVQAKVNNGSTVSEQHYTRIGEDYEILNGTMLLSKKDGTVWYWDTLAYSSHSSDPFYQAKLKQIPGLRDVKQFSFDGKNGESRLMTNYAALKKDGTVWYWDSRNNTYPVDSRIAPKPIKDLNHVTSLVADYTGNSKNYKTLFVLKSDGSVWCWIAQQGKASSTSYYKILDNVASIKSVNGHVYAVKKEGSVWKWRTYMYWPQNSKFYDKNPEQIIGLEDIVNIEMGGTTNYAYKKDGTVWSWKTYDKESTPIQIRRATGARGIVQFSSQLKDSNIDTTYALLTDDKLWSIDSDKVFPELSNIASVHHKDKGSYMENYVLKKDQTLWAWKDNVSAFPKLVVFTNESAAGNRSGSTEKPTSDRAETKTQPELIRMTSPEVSLYPFITMLQPGGQQSIAVNNVLPGTKITYTIDDPSIGTITNVNGLPVITANKSGQTIVRATTSRAGFPEETTYILLYVVDGSMVSDTYFSAVRSIPDADKQNSAIVEGLMQAGELVITAASSEKPTPVDGQIVITPELIDKLAGNASRAKSAVQQALSENKIVPARDLIVNAEILSSPTQNEYMFKLNKSGLVGRKDIDYITVYAGDAKLVFNVATAQRLFQSQSVIVIHLVKENNGEYRIQFLDEQGQELSGVASNIQLILPATYADAVHNSMFYVNGQTKEPIGGKYNSSKNGMEAEINRSGTYLVDDNSKSFPDINDRDPELKQAVQFLGSKGIVTGKDNGNFEPDSLLTRAEFTAMLVRAFNVMDEKAKESFSDVHPPQWHHPFIASSEKNHIVEGYPDGTFKPDRTIERQEMTAIGARFLHERKHYYYPSNPDEYLNRFVDKETVSKWAKPTMSLAVKQRLIDVPANKQIKAKEAVTRGEAARMLYRLYLQL